MQTNGLRPFAQFCYRFLHKIVTASTRCRRGATWPKPCPSMLDGLLYPVESAKGVSDDIFRCEDVVAQGILPFPLSDFLRSVGSAIAAHRALRLPLIRLQPGRADHGISTLLALLRAGRAIN